MVNNIGINKSKWMLFSIIQTILPPQIVTTYYMLGGHIGHLSTFMNLSCRFWPISDPMLPTTLGYIGYFGRTYWSRCMMTKFYESIPDPMVPTIMIISFFFPFKWMFLWATASGGKKRGKEDQLQGNNQQKKAIRYNNFSSFVILVCFNINIKTRFL